MNDETRATRVEAPVFWVGARWSLGHVIDWLLVRLGGDEHAALLMLLAHIDGEAARTAAAVTAATAPRNAAEHLMSTYERVLLRRAEKAEAERDLARAQVEAARANCQEILRNRREAMQARAVAAQVLVAMDGAKP